LTTLKAQMASDLTAAFYNPDEFAEAAIYTPINWEPGDPETVDCNIIVDHDVLIQADGYDASVATLGTTVTAQVSDVGTANRGDTFTLDGDGTEYTVQRIDQYSDDGLEVTMVVK